MYYIYILKCQNSSLYTGISTDYKKRYDKHREGKGAKYTKINKPIKLERVWKAKNRSEATKIEIYIKKKSKKYKEIISKSSTKLLVDVKINCNIEIENVDFRGGNGIKRDKIY